MNIQYNSEMNIPLKHKIEQNWNTEKYVFSHRNFCNIQRQGRTKYTDRNCNAYTWGFIRTKKYYTEIYIDKSTYSKWVLLNLSIVFVIEFFRECALKLGEKYSGKTIYQISQNTRSSIDASIFFYLSLLTSIFWWVSIDTSIFSYLFLLASIFGLNSIDASIFSYLFCQSVQFSSTLFFCSFYLLMCHP